jgi:hypothetical protein
MAVRDVRPNMLAQAVIFNLALARCPVRISVRTLTILNETFRGVLTPSRKITEYIVKLGDDCFILRHLKLVIHQHLIN